MNRAQESLDDAKDYVYSSWNDLELKAWLSSHAVNVPEHTTTREQLLKAIKEPFAKQTPVYDRFSTEYLHDWLVSHGYIDSKAEKNRKELVALAKKYYYNAHDTVFGSWKDNELHQWLVKHGYVKSDFQASRDEYLKLVNSKFAKTQDSLWEGWLDSDMRNYLHDHGYLKTPAEKKRDELIKLMQQHAASLSATANDYITWSDARLRGFLHAHGVPPSQLPDNRQQLLRKTRAYYTTSWASNVQNAAHAVVDQLKTGVLDFLGMPEKHAEFLGSEKLGSYSAEASKSASSLKASASSLAQSVRDEL